MSDDTNNKPTLTRKPLTLSRSLESGEVKQTFSHGRTNKVVVEVKRKRLVGKPGGCPALGRTRLGKTHQTKELNRVSRGPFAAMTPDVK